MEEYIKYAPIVIIVIIVIFFIFYYMYPPGEKENNKKGKKLDYKKIYKDVHDDFEDGTITYKKFKKKTGIKDCGVFINMYRYYKNTKKVKYEDFKMEIKKHYSSNSM